MRTLRIGPVLLYTLVFHLAVLARLSFSPLLVTIERDLGVGHAAATSFFLLMSAGYAVAVLASGFLASAINHRGTILVSIFGVALSLLLLSRTASLLHFRLGGFTLGLAAGLYTASGMASIMNLVEPRNVGKAISIHEVAPNLASIIAPAIVVALLSVMPWRLILVVFAAGCAAAGLVFFGLDRSSKVRGEAPRFRTLRIYVRNPEFWALAGLFAFSASAALGVYSVLPTYLVAERGYTDGLAAALIGISRIIGFGVIFGSGWLADHLGPRRLLVVTVAATSVWTIALGVLPDSLLAVAVVLQPLIAVAFFPAALTQISRIGPPRSRNVALSLNIAIAVTVGGGLFPWLAGILGEAGGFSLSFAILGVAMGVISPLLVGGIASESEA